MKKTIILLAGIAAMLCACSKIEKPAEEKVSLKLNFTIGGESPMDDGSAETKVHKTAWANNDIVYILFDEGFSTGSYLKIRCKKSSNNISWEAVEWSPGLEAKIAKKTGGELAALYMPNDKVGGTIEFSNIVGSSRCVVTARDRLGNIYYSYWLDAHHVAYTVSGEVLSANITLTCSLRRSFTQFTLPDIDRNGKRINADGSGQNICKYKLAANGHGTTIRSYTPSYWYLNENGFRYDEAFWMSAYYYQKLMFSGNVSSNYPVKWKFTVTDGTDSYDYTLPEGKILEFGHTYNLPPLNDTSKWIKQ